MVSAYLIPLPGVSTLPPPGKRNIYYGDVTSDRDASVEIFGVFLPLPDPPPPCYFFVSDVFGTTLCTRSLESRDSFQFRSFRFPPLLSLTLPVSSAFLPRRGVLAVNPAVLNTTLLRSPVSTFFFFFFGHSSPLVPLAFQDFSVPLVFEEF